MSSSKNKRGDKKQPKSLRGYLKAFWILFLGMVAAVIFFFLCASWGVFGPMPTFDELENPASNVATEIISSDGKTIGKFYLENRVPVKYEDLPEYLVNALIATEDERFKEHSGIDARGTLRAITSVGSSGGASTITQQLAKLLFHGEGSRSLPKRITQKAKEWVIAVKLERQYTKEEILTMYLNKADFVNNAVGIRSATRIYMGKEPKDLTIDEAAMFVGMLQNPAYFNPVRRPELVHKRRNVVLHQMARNGFISKEESVKLQELPLALNFTPESHREGIATYFREYLRDYMRRWVKENPKKDGTTYDIYRDGLKIYVSIDSRMQKYGEEAVEAHIANLQEEFFIDQKNNKMAPFYKINQQEVDNIMMRAMKTSERWRQMKEQGKSESDIIKSFDVKTEMRIFSWKGERDTVMTPKDSIRYYKHFLQAGMMAMEPQTGHIKAWVGGINYKHFQYDHVGQGARQVGSTFKPFVYATAIEQLHYSPCDSIIDSPFTMPKGRYGISRDWSPQNSNRSYRGIMTLKQALAGSVNTITAKLMDKVGPKAVVNMCRDLGISGDIPQSPAIALGAVDITVSDMVAAYSTFANQGIYVKPIFITRIADKNGVILFNAIPETKDVVSKDVAYAIIKLLEGVTESGSGVRLRTTWQGAGYKRVTGHPYKFTNPIAGKTGTSQNNSDGWFIGMVPNLATGVWVGNDDRAAHFRTMTYGQGATLALPIWGIFMNKCYADKSLEVAKSGFPVPEHLSIRVDCTKIVQPETDDVSEGALDTEEFDF
ncbi:transglycosylase domain-containing protein [Myroides odoratimimus]|uniref:1A family penicillin-binding protein n=2 Tax=Myroides odoratimimus TaxID=76832 RepID=A0ABN0EBG5_9FLAO|nr:MULTISPECIES: transglycosylase domain-containing protein [Myroides]AJA68428.1 Membrane carboxypeptidase/penicillin-binding protein [Myroides sp. A21]APA91748.1 penicillin-binding protein [Myroides sp. ZB35]EHO10722.1 1A family penicillin-binding protein [Myroides odoratimimus CCUG 10230]EHO14988.1 1A family penicillin-binding protein [Myroides odoratimimus CCUG 12901]EHO15028.1 1A family penicillin-binding protein [Myroides odoratimimus CIP 101113]